jgi:hypothetical protein
MLRVLALAIFTTLTVAALASIVVATLSVFFVST